MYVARSAERSYFEPLRVANINLYLYGAKVVKRK